MTDQASAYHVPVLSHYAIWYGPNIDVLSAAVPSRDPRGTIKPGADYFRFYDVLELEAEVDGEMVRFYSGPRNYSSFYFPGGGFLTGDDRDNALRRRGISFELDKYLVIWTRYRVVLLTAEELAGADVEFPPLASSDVV